MVALLAIVGGFFMFQSLGRAGKVRHARGSDLGRPVSDFTLPDTRGLLVSLPSRMQANAVVLVFTGIDCPIGNLYMPRLAELARTYAPRGVRFLAVNSNAHETTAQIESHARSHRLPFPTLKDWGNALADRLRVDRVGEVLVLDANHRLRYRGAIDNQYARGAVKEQPTQFYLVDALEAVLAGTPVQTALTPVVTCPIERVPPERLASRLDRTLAIRPPARNTGKATNAPAQPGGATYSSGMANLINRRCATCHQPGEAAPFSLLTYADVKNHATSIREVVDERLMPPWRADKRHGTFSNDRSLTEEERERFLAWIDQGLPPGDPALPTATAPEPRHGWTIGEPDLVFEMPEAFDVPVNGLVPIQKFYVPTNLKEDVWVQAAQAMPGDRSMVHHICIFIIDPATASHSGRSREMTEARRRERPELVCYAPGDMPAVYPEGVAKKLPAGCVLEFQVHYQTVGEARFERSSVGLRLARSTVRRAAVTRSAACRELTLPPGAVDVVKRAEYTLLQDGLLLSLTPHMHYRGKSFQFDAVTPDGRRDTLLFVPSYTFNWQDVYRLAQPRFLPRGTRIECTAHFDNSAQNPLNPDPTQEVHWGEQSSDEMMVGYFDYCVDLARPIEPVPPSAVVPAL